MFRRGRALGTLAFAVGAVAVGISAAPASAGLGIACPDPTTKVFQPWSDYANYAYVPNGGFESGGYGWSLSRGASVVAGNESYYVSGGDDRASLALPAGATATTPPMCIGLISTKMRFFVSGDPGAQVKVQPIYHGLLSTLLGILDGNTVTSTGEWQPSQPIGMLGGLLPLLTSSVQFRFTATGGGTVHIDDIYLDPMRSG